jgi:hypothetical protein
VDCDDQVTGADSLRVLRFVADVDADSSGCPPVGTQAEKAASGGARFRGDVDCDGVVGPLDALIILRYSSGDKAALPPSCD